MKRLLVVGLTSAALALTPALVQSADAGPSGAVRAPAVDGPRFPDDEGRYLPALPTRLLDTRGSGGRLAPGATRSVQITNRAEIPPGGASAVVVNLTVTGGTRAGYLSAYPGGTGFNGTSSLNFAAGETRANLVTVPVGSNGAITVLNGGGPGTGPAHVIVDVQGYYLNGEIAVGRRPALFRGAYDGFAERVLDTRSNGYGPQGPGDYVYFGYYEEDLDPIIAYALNVTAVGATAPGYLVAWNGDDDTFPNTSTLNFAKGRTTPNNVVVPATRAYDAQVGKYYYRFAVENASATARVQLLIDVVGVYTQSAGDGDAFRPLARPERIVDTRVGKGLPSKLSAGQTQQLTAPDLVLGPDPDNAFDLVGNLTAVKPTSGTYLTLYPDFTDYPRPETSNLNPAARQTVANHTFTSLGNGNRVNLFNAAGSTDVLLDVAGYFLRVPSEDAMRRSTGALRTDRPSMSRPSALARGHVADTTAGSR